MGWGQQKGKKKGQKLRVGLHGEKTKMRGCYQKVLLKGGVLFLTVKTERVAFEERLKNGTRMGILGPYCKGSDEGGGIPDHKKTKAKATGRDLNLARDLPTSNS